jgi:hypothetical protein
VCHGILNFVLVVDLWAQNKTQNRVAQMLFHSLSNKKLSKNQKRQGERMPKKRILAGRRISVGPFTLGA